MAKKYRAVQKITWSDGSAVKKGELLTPAQAERLKGADKWLLTQGIVEEVE